MEELVETYAAMLQAGAVFVIGGAEVVTADGKRAQAVALKEEGNELAKRGEKSEARDDRP